MDLSCCPSKRPRRAAVVILWDLPSAILLGLSAFRVEGDLNGFSVLHPFYFIMRLPVLQAFHCFQAGTAAKVFLRGGANRFRQRTEFDRGLGPKDFAIGICDEEFNMLAAHSGFDIIDHSS